jgi:hypothetical protein
MQAAAVAFHAEHKPETITLADVSPRLLSPLFFLELNEFIARMFNELILRAGAAHLRQGCRLVTRARSSRQAGFLGKQVANAYMCVKRCGVRALLLLRALRVSFASPPAPHPAAVLFMTHHNQSWPSSTRRIWCMIAFAVCPHRLSTSTLSSPCLISPVMAWAIGNFSFAMAS